MYSQFQQTFVKDTHSLKSSAPLVFSDNFESSIRELLSSFNGASFNDGLYRIMPAQGIKTWNASIGTVFPGFRGRVFCFGYDWLGRIFAVDMRTERKGEVLLIDIGANEVLQIPCNVLTFHNEELVNNREAALAFSFYQRWRSIGAAPATNQCIGYKTPLFLGGKDDLENLELSDLDVYWTICGQLIAKIRSQGQRR